MHSSRSQSLLVVALSVGLGFSLASSRAIGYPAGPTVSLAHNPIQSYGGVLEADSSVTLDTLPADQDFIVTDVTFSARSNDHDCLDRIEVRLASSGTTVGSYLASTAYSRGSSTNLTRAEPVSVSMASGIEISAGGTLELHTSLFSSFTYSGCSSSRGAAIQYAVSGYYAQP